MKVENSKDSVAVVLGPAEVRLLRWVLERALFIDTPPKEQPAIAAFAGRLLEALPPSERGGESK